MFWKQNKNMNGKVQITSNGIKKAISRYTPMDSLCEYIWNGFDAGATKVKVQLVEKENIAGSIDKIIKFLFAPEGMINQL